ncbi:MAG TPA: ribonuclease III [Phycisphaerae bacterium]|nr:ribonuclease III [Phycisphaerae bacterium]
MTQSEVFQRAQQAVRHQFQNHDLLLMALTHASVANTRLESNERLEFLGDAVLGFVVCEELYRRYGHYLEGDLTKIKSVVVSGKVCALIADEIGLSDLLFLGKGMRDRNGLPLSLKAAAFESLVAAVYLDAGLEAARDFILQHVRPHIQEAASSATQHNYKSYLQQHAQQYLSTTPRYEALDEQGPDHSKCFEICVSIGRRRFPSAWGPSKKEAEQKAAFRALQELNLTERDEEYDGSAGAHDAGTPPT